MPRPDVCTPIQSATLQPCYPSAPNARIAPTTRGDDIQLSEIFVRGWGSAAGVVRRVLFESSRGRWEGGEDRADDMGGVVEGETD
jgi:hypothetical protein